MFNSMTVNEAKKILEIDVLTPSIIKTAYRKRAKETHPDTGGDAKEFQKVEQAYDLLKDYKPGKSHWGGLNPFAKPTVEKDLSMGETDFVKDVTGALEGLGAMVFKIHGHGMQESGWPDLQIYHRKWTGHVEAKVKDRAYTTLQKIKMRDLRKRGTPAIGLRYKDGAVVAEDETGEALCHISAEAWKIKHGNARGTMLFELFTTATAELQRRQQ